MASVYRRFQVGCQRMATNNRKFIYEITVILQEFVAHAQTTNVKTSVPQYSHGVVTCEYHNIIPHNKYDLYVAKHVAKLLPMRHSM